MIRHFCDLCGKELRYSHICIINYGLRSCEKKFECCEKCSNRLEKYIDRILKHEDK